MKANSVPKVRKTRQPDKVILIDRNNYNLMMNHFERRLKNLNTKFVFFNIELSNLKYSKNLTEILKNQIDEINLKKLFMKINEIRMGTDFKTPQIIYTEFIVVKEKEKEFRITIYLLPSLKFHKFIEKETLIDLNPEILSYLNIHKRFYPFNSVCDIKTLSYLNLSVNDKMNINYEKILKEGKPSKKENQKSYFFFPKNLVIPDTNTQLKLKDFLIDILNFMNTRKSEIMNETMTCNIDYHEIEVENNFYIVEKLFNFEWRNILNPFDLNLIRSEIKKFTIKYNNLKLNKTEEDNKIINFFIKLCQDFKKYFSSFLNRFDLDNSLSDVNDSYILNIISKNKIQEQQTFVMEVNKPETDVSDVIEDKFFRDWIFFLENYFNFKLLITYQKEVDIFKFLLTLGNLSSASEIKQIQSLIKFLEFLIQSLNLSLEEIPSNNDLSFSEQDLLMYKSNAFDIFSLFPRSLLKFYSYTYFLNFKIDLKLLNNVTLPKNYFNSSFDDLFLNLKNDMKILFDYELESSLYHFINQIDNQIDEELLGFSTKVISIKEENFCRDLEFICDNKEDRKKIKTTFDNIIYKLKVNSETLEFTFSYKEINTEKLKFFSEKLKLNKREIKFSLIKIFKEIKKKTQFEEEFGVANFFNRLFSSDHNFLIGGSNLFFNYLNIYTEIFNYELNAEQFISFLKKKNLIDLNLICLSTGNNFLNLMNSISLSINNEPEYISYKLFNLFNYLKNEYLDLDKYINKIYIPYRYSANSCLIMNSEGCIINETLEILEGQRTNIKNKSIIVKFNNYKELIQLCEDYSDFMINQLDSDVFEVCMIDIKDENFKNFKLRLSEEKLIN